MLINCEEDPDNLLPMCLLAGTDDDPLPLESEWTPVGFGLPWTAASFIAAEFKCDTCLISDGCWFLDCLS